MWLVISTPYQILCSHAGLANDMIFDHSNVARISDL
jgi:hypothetical protein